MTASHRVDTTEPAQADMGRICRWPTANAGADVADRFPTEVVDRIDPLEHLPQRGGIPPMLDHHDETVRRMPVQADRLIDDVNTLAVVHERRRFVTPPVTGCTADAVAERGWPCGRIAG